MHGTCQMMVARACRIRVWSGLESGIDHSTLLVRNGNGQRRQTKSARVQTDPWGRVRRVYLPKHRVIRWSLELIRFDDEARTVVVVLE